MRCRDLYPWMSLRLDGRLPEPQRRLLQAHLVSCPTCAQTWVRWQEVDRLFAGAPPVSPDEGFAARVLHRLDGELAHDATRRRTASVRLTLGLGVACALLFLAGSACAALLCAMSSPGTLVAVATTMNRLIRIADTCLEALQLLLWGTASLPAFVVAAAYVALAFGALATWLRATLFRPALQTSAAGSESGVSYRNTGLAEGE